MLKVFVVPGLWVAGIRGIFLEAGYELSRSLTDADVVVWTGGADINPEIYNERALQGTYHDLERDKYEIAAFRALPKTGGPLKVGICRGAQLLCALSGGSLWQDVEGHGHEHDVMDTRTGELITCSSLHHQEMIPPPDAIVWGRAKEAFKKVRIDKGNKVIYAPLMTKYEDVEVLWVPHTESFCFQPHPEMGPKSCTEYFFKCIDRALIAKAKLKENRRTEPAVIVSGLTDHFDKLKEQPKEIQIGQNTLY